MTEPVPSRQRPRDERRPRGDASRSAGTSGDLFGLSGRERRALAIGWLVGMATVSLIIFLDIVSKLDAQPTRGVWPPVIEEMSSWLVITVLIFIPAGVAVWLRRGPRPMALMVPVHALAALTYLVLHVAGFTLIRHFAFPWLARRPDHMGPFLSSLLFEGAKDVPAYAFACAGFWLFLKYMREPDAPAEAESFDIRDGARLVRAPIGEILAVRSAGNYAEFVLADGRTPLMRAALGALERQLADAGFVRTHRSWLVNSRRVTGLRPDGSGDYTVELGAVEAPLSRRFPEALARLRG